MAAWGLVNVLLFVPVYVENHPADLLSLRFCFCQKAFRRGESLQQLSYTAHTHAWIHVHKHNTGEIVRV